MIILLTIAHDLVKIYGLLNHDSIHWYDVHNKEMIMPHDSISYQGHIFIANKLNQHQFLLYVKDEHGTVYIQDGPTGPVLSIISDVDSIYKFHGGVIVKTAQLSGKLSSDLWATEDRFYLSEHDNYISSLSLRNPPVDINQIRQNLQDNCKQDCLLIEKLPIVYQGKKVMTYFKETGRLMQTKHSESELFHTIQESVLM